MKVAFLNDHFIEEEKCSIHFSDLALQRGYGIFEYFRLIGNIPVFLDDHLTRFFHSAEQLRLASPYNKEQLKKIIDELISRNNLPGTGIRITLTGGNSVDGISISDPNIIITQSTFKTPGVDQREKGISLATYEYQRQLPEAKTIDYLMAIWLQPFLISRQADDLLYYSQQCITECPRNNFFIVTEDEKIITPKNRILKGITRKKVLEVAAKEFAIEERDIKIEELHTAHEAFITSTTKKILQVAAIDEKVFTNNSVVKKLQKLLDKELEQLA